MRTRMLLFIILAVLQVNFAFGQNSPCDSYNDLPILPYMAERVVGHQPVQKPISDRFLTPGWYRMESYVLSSSKEKCGTTTSWYRNGSLSSQTTHVTVCRNDGTECATLKQIEVRRCDENYVFNLQPLGIENAYCIESLNGATDTTVPDISTMKVRPNIVVEIQQSQLVHYCDVRPEDASLLYQVEWSLTSKMSKDLFLKRSPLMKYSSGFREATVLKETDLNKNGIRKVGYTIICALTAKKGIAGMASLPVESPPKYCGFEVEPKGTLMMTENKPNAIRVRTTVPFSCTTNGFNVAANCPLLVLLYIPEKTYDCRAPSVRIEGTACGAKINTSEVNVWKDIRIRPISPDQKAKFKQVEYGAFLTVETDYHEFFRVQLPPVRVMLDFDNSILDNKQCFALSDPHFLTFDGKTFDVHEDGTYVLYKNVFYRQEVRLGKCPTWATYPLKPYCVEAVAIAAGQDVFIEDIPRAEIGFRLCENGVLHRAIKRLGERAFEITLPTGTRVTIDNRTFKDFLEIRIYPSLLDWTTCSGLCGNFDGIASNDANLSTTQPHLISEQTLKMSRITLGTKDLFRTQTKESLFEYEDEYYFCECDESNNHFAQTTDFEKTAATCTAQHTKACNVSSSSIFRCDLRERKKRGNLDIHSSVSTNFFNRANSQVRSLNTRLTKRAVAHGVEYDEATARRECAGILNTTLTQMCTTLPNFNIDTYVENCALDALISGSFDWAPVHLEGLKASCIRYVEFNQPMPPEVLKNLSASVDWMFNDTGDETLNNKTTLATTTLLPVSTTVYNPVFSPEMLTRIKDIACPGDCNEHGVCVKGECKCEDGYFDIDCGQDIREPPLMVGIPDLGLCDLTMRECVVTSVLGRNFIRTSLLSCRLIPFEITSNGHTTDDPVFLNGSLETFVEVKCQLPPPRDKRSTPITNDNRIARGYQVSVSNDGHAFCEEDPIVIYDSICVNCSKHEGIVPCFKLPGFCMQNGRCVEPGQTHACRTCHINGIGLAEWKPSAECEDPIQHQDGKLPIIGAVVGSLVAVAAVIALTYCVMFKKSVYKRKKLGSVNPITSTQIEKVNS